MVDAGVNGFVDPDAAEEDDAVTTLMAASPSISVATAKRGARAITYGPRALAGER